MQKSNEFVANLSKKMGFLSLHQNASEKFYSQKGAFSHFHRNIETQTSLITINLLLSIYVAYFCIVECVIILVCGSI